MQLKQKQCRICNQTFMPTRKAQKFCSTSCRHVHKNEWRRNSIQYKDAKNRLGKKYYQQTKDDVFHAYGGYRCVCCSETNVKFLTIDHVAQNGAKHRKETNGAAVKLYRWLKKHNYPDGFQVLCYNCNCGRTRNGGVCPHKEN